jgi:hypothetical protein
MVTVIGNSSYEKSGVQISVSITYDAITQNAISEYVYIGTDKIQLGEYFEVTNNGELTVTNGKIGGLNISDASLYSDDRSVYLDKNGIIANKIDIANTLTANKVLTEGMFNQSETAGFDYNCKSSLMEDVTITISNNGLNSSSDTFTVTATYRAYASAVGSESGSYVYKYSSKNVTISKNASSATVTFDRKNGQYTSYTYYFLYTYSVSPKTVRQKSGDVSVAVGVKGSLIPTETKSYLGDSDNKWAEVWATNGTIQTSDLREKNTIESINNQYSLLFDALRPVTFKFNDGTSDRKHIGFIANEVKESLEELNISTKDFAAYCEWKNSDGETGCGLRYTEFIALNTYEIQQLKKRVAYLEGLLKDQKETE